MNSGLRLNVEDLSIDSFVPDDSTLPTDGVAAVRIYRTVYVYVETEQMSCGATCGCHWV